MLIKTFTGLCRRMLTDWSRNAADQSKAFSLKPSPPSLETEISAWHYLQRNENKDFLAQQIVRGSYIVRGSMADKMRFSQWSRRLTHPSKLKSFAEFSVWSRAYYSVEKRNNGLLICSCPVGLKKYVCKHSVAVNVAKNRFELNPLAKSLPLGFKRGRGRPKQVGPTLSQT